MVSCAHKVQELEVAQPHRLDVSTDWSVLEAQCLGEGMDVLAGRGQAEGKQAGSKKLPSSVSL